MAEDKPHDDSKFFGFESEYTPELFKDIWHEDCPEVHLGPGVEQVLFKLSLDFVEDFVQGSSSLVSIRKGKSLEAKDLILYLKMQYNFDPLLLSDEYYYVSELPSKSNSPTPTVPIQLSPRRKKRRTDN
ncbi:hypothetical protein CDAR_491921 [Caerostris darwini]|uniref:Transcription initiation factor TFIID subunit 12 n=1 Tax=Caerostris darwini TaxID=1538125 RepID=A0AAV4VLI1_9ARAC|nr:hypothetical protein CDAR_491921 [Caerostris darwini]